MPDFHSFRDSGEANPACFAGYDKLLSSGKPSKRPSVPPRNHPDDFLVVGKAFLPWGPKRTRMPRRSRKKILEEVLRMYSGRPWGHLGLPSIPGMV